MKSENKRIFRVIAEQYARITELEEQLDIADSTIRALVSGDGLASVRKQVALCIIVTVAESILRCLRYLRNATVSANRLLSILPFALFARTLVLVMMKGGAAMPNDAFYIICPYYHKVMGNNLFCECFSGDNNYSTEECRIKQSFSSRKQRNEFINKYCSGFEYMNCSIAAINTLVGNVEKKF